MRTVGKQGWKQEEILQIKNEDGLDKGDKNRCWEKGPEARYIWKVMGFVHKCEVGEKSRIGLRFSD